MADKRNDGGPAFACAAENGHQEGMKLRDWFAGQASCNPGFCFIKAGWARCGETKRGLIILERGARP
jgi:hypothetical protein